jgi:hypothetical protein
MEEEKKIKPIVDKVLKKEYNLNYYTKHRDIILTKIKEKVPCKLCGCLISGSNTSRHWKSKKCNKLQEQQNNTNSLD